MKLLKRAVAVIAALLLLAVSGVGVKFYVLSPRYRPAPELHAPTTAAAIARGQYLATSIAMCVSCHSQSDVGAPGQPVVPGTEFQGRHFAMPGFPGDVRGPNLTPDPETGIGRWSDGELVRAMREGVSRDGRPLFPMMPYRAFAASLSDDDALAIVAYLRSLPPRRSDVGITTLKFPISMLVRAAPQPVDRAAPPLPDEPLARGRQLLALGNCSSCHDSHDERHEPLPGKHLAGGDTFPLPNGGTVYAANISSDPGTGIGALSDADLERALRDGVGKSGRPLYFMPFTVFKNMTGHDMRALIVALRAEPAVMNIVPAMKPGSVAQAQ